MNKADELILRGASEALEHARGMNELIEKVGDAIMCCGTETDMAQAALDVLSVEDLIKMFMARGYNVKITIEDKTLPKD